MQGMWTIPDVYYIGFAGLCTHQFLETDNIRLDTQFMLPS